jgi:Methylamine utilisation protein MauE
MFTFDPVPSLALTACVATLFFAAAVHKLREPARFVDVLRGYQVLPRRLTPYVAVWVVLMELSVVAGSAFPATRALAMVLAVMLLVLYASAIGVNLARGRTRIDCGCVGFGERDRIGAWMIRRNLLLAAAAAIAALPVAPRVLATMDIFVIVCATCAAAGLYITQSTLRQVNA